MIFNSEGKEIQFTPIVTGLGNDIYVYKVTFLGQLQDQGYVIVSSKVLQESGEEVIFYHVNRAESNEVFITEMPFLFTSVEALLKDLVPELVNAIGTYISQFRPEARGDA